MSAPGFGFSVGDFFAALQLIGKISTALKNSGGAADDYQSLRIELQQLQLLLEQLRDLPTASTSSLNHYNAVRGMACQVQIPLRDFVNKMRSYHEKLGVSNDQPAWRSAKRKMQWAISMREDVREMRAVVTMKIVSVSVLLTIPIGQNLARIETRLVENNISLREKQAVATERLIQHQTVLKDEIIETSQSIQIDTTRLLNICIGLAIGVERLDKRQIKLQHQLITCSTIAARQMTKDMNRMTRSTRFLQIYAMKTFAAIDQVLKLFTNFSKEALQYLQKLHLSNMQIYELLLRMQNSLSTSPTSMLKDNIRFVDVLNREQSLPYAYFQHWEVFESMLLCNFKGKPGETKIQCGRYLLMNPKIPSNRITRDEWSRLVFPGSEVHMSILLARLYGNGNKCPRYECSGTASNPLLDATASTWVECNNCALKYTLYGKSESQSSAQARSRYYAGTLSRLQQAHDRVLNSPYISATGPGLVDNIRARYEEEKDGYRSHTSQDKQSKDLDRPQTNDSTLRKKVIARILRREGAIHKLNVLCWCIKAIMSFQKLVTMLRKREEEELRAFRTVHTSEPNPRRRSRSQPRGKIPLKVTPLRGFKPS